MIEMKGITCCGDCGYYNWKKHKCTRATDEGDARSTFYADCPLPDVVPVQEPHVLTLEEALKAEVNVDQCWLEVKGITWMYLADAVVCPEHLERCYIQRWGASDCQLPLDLYGAYWRMWSAKPTKEQREAEPWQA